MNNKFGGVQMCGNTSYLNGSLRRIVLPYCPTLCTSHVGGSAFGAVCRLTRLCSFWIGKVQVQQQDLCSSHVFIRKKQKKKKVQSLGIQLGGSCLYPKICFFFFFTVALILRNPKIISPCIYTISSYVRV